MGGPALENRPPSTPDRPPYKMEDRRDETRPSGRVRDTSRIAHARMVRLSSQRSNMAVVPLIHSSPATPTATPTRLAANGGRMRDQLRCERARPSATSALAWVSMLTTLETSGRGASD